MSGLQKVAVLLKSMPGEVVDKVMRLLDPRHAGLVSAELAKLAEQKDLGQKLESAPKAAKGAKKKGKAAADFGGEKREFDIEGKREKK